MTGHPAPATAQVSDLTVRYGGTTALDRLSVTFTAGAICGLLGRNGSGKTTLLSTIAAFRPPTSGTVRVDGGDPYDDHSTAARICLIREGADVFDGDRVRQVLTLAHRLRPFFDHGYALRLLDRFRIPTNKRVRHLSRGQRSALACVLGLASRAPLTMFDETHLGMDAPSRYAFVEELLADYAEHPRTVVIATHLIGEFSSLFEHVVVIDRGRLLVADTVEALLAKAAAVTGPADEVAALTDAYADRLTVVAQRRLGDTAAVTVFGPAAGELAQAADEAGLRPEAVPLQDLVVHLTDGTPTTAPAGAPGASTGARGTSAGTEGKEEPR